MSDGILVTVTDLMDGASETQEIMDDFVVITAGCVYVAHTQHYPSTGTTVLTIKREDTRGA